MHKLTRKLLCSIRTEPDVSDKHVASIFTRIKNQVKAAYKLSSVSVGFLEGLASDREAGSNIMISRNCMVLQLRRLYSSRKIHSATSIRTVIDKTNLSKNLQQSLQHSLKIAKSGHILVFVKHRPQRIGNCSLEAINKELPDYRTRPPLWTVWTV